MVSKLSPPVEGGPGQAALFTSYCLVFSVLYAFYVMSIFLLNSLQIESIKLMRNATHAGSSSCADTRT